MPQKPHFSPCLQLWFTKEAKHHNPAAYPVPVVPSFPSPFTVLLSSSAGHGGGGGQRQSWWHCDLNSVRNYTIYIYYIIYIYYYITIYIILICIYSYNMGMGRSWEDHGKIMGRSWEDHGKIMGRSWVCFWPFPQEHDRFIPWHNPPIRNRRHPSPKSHHPPGTIEWWHWSVRSWRWEETNGDFFTKKHGVFFQG